MPRAISRPMLPVETTSMPWPRIAPSLRRMIEPLPYSFSMAAKARSIALLLFLGSSMAMVLKLGRGRARARSSLACRTHTVNLFSFQLFSPGRSAEGGPFVLSPAAMPVFAILGGVMGCDGSSASSPGDLASTAGRLEPASTAAHAAGESTDPFGALGLDGGSLEVRLDPPAPAGDLKAEIARFTTLDACVDGLARVDPIAGDALEAIGYDTFLRDACRVLDATKANDPGRCPAIEASSLEARCRTTVAEV